ncbi:MAG: hypothetical protein A2X77_00775 [Gammaproteobacteria bacterium GWE2_42_36]|nr:MAG: hypothetical protein A2X77_00775 [Gammaproteobacteria bacterium GWE2_42_36]HCU05640.1 hypothetical protein [Coxiellaceae bacterium]
MPVRHNKKTKTPRNEETHQLRTAVLEEIAVRETRLKEEHGRYALSLTEAEILFRDANPQKVGDHLFLYPIHPSKNSRLHALYQDLKQKRIGVRISDSLWDSSQLNEENPDDLAHQLALTAQDAAFQQLIAVYTRDAVSPLDLPIDLARTAFNAESSPHLIETDSQHSLAYLYTQERDIYAQGEYHLQSYTVLDTSKKQPIPGSIISEMQPNPDLTSKHGWEYLRVSSDCLYLNHFLLGKLKPRHFHDAFTWIQEQSIDKIQWGALSDEDKRKTIWLTLSMDTEGVLTQKILRQKRYRRYLEQCSPEELVSLMRDLMDRQRAAEIYAKNPAKNDKKSNALVDAIKTNQDLAAQLLRSQMSDPPDRQRMGYALIESLQKTADIALNIPLTIERLTDSISLASHIAKQLAKNTKNLLSLQNLVRRKTTTLDQLRQVREADFYGLFAGRKVFSKKPSRSLSKTQRALLDGEMICSNGSSTPLNITLSFVLNVSDQQLRALTFEERAVIATTLSKNHQGSILEKLLLEARDFRNQLIVAFDPEKRRSLKISLQKHLSTLGIHENQIDSALEKLECVTYAVGTRRAFDGPAPQSSTLTRHCCVELLQGRPAGILSDHDLTGVLDYMKAVHALVKERAILRENLSHGPKKTEEKRALKQKLQRQDDELMHYGISPKITTEIMTQWLSQFESSDQFNAFKQRMTHYASRQQHLTVLKKHPWKNRAEIRRVKQSLEADLKTDGFGFTLPAIFENIQQWAPKNRTQLPRSHDDLEQLRRIVRPMLPLPKRKDTTLDNLNPTGQSLAESSSPSVPPATSSTSTQVMNLLPVRPQITRLPAQREAAIMSPETPAQTLSHSGIFAHQAANTSGPNFLPSTPGHAKYGDLSEKKHTLMDYLDLEPPSPRLAMAP